MADRSCAYCNALPPGVGGKGKFYCESPRNNSGKYNFGVPLCDCDDASSCRFNKNENNLGEKVDGN